MTDWRARLLLIAAIVRKDLRRSLWPWISAIVTATILGFLLAPAAFAIALPRPPAFVWFDSTLRAFYAIAALLATVTLGLTFYAGYSGEVTKGTIRSIILYPVDANDVLIAKLLSSLVLSLGFSLILFFGPMAAFFVSGLYPFGPFLAVLLMAVLMAFLALATGAFLAHVLARSLRRMVVSPTGLGLLFMVFAILLTETVATQIGLQIITMGAQSQGRILTQQDFLSVVATARAISVLSPYHLGAQLLAGAFGIPTGFPDVYVVVPVAVLVLLGGYLLGRKLYLDLLVQ